MMIIIVFQEGFASACSTNQNKSTGPVSTDIWEVSILDQYWARPDIRLFTNMCLAVFAAKCRVRKCKTEAVIRYQKV